MRPGRMDASDFRRLAAPLVGRPGALRAFLLVARVLRWAFYLAFGVLVAWVGVAAALGSDASLALGPRDVSWTFFARLVLTAGVSFALVSLARRLIDAPRPYDVLEIEPLIARGGAGEGFPSRHVFSCFLIATLWLAWLPAVGAILYVLGLVVALTRVVGGVHYPRDVLAGALIGLACGVLGMWA